MLMRYSVRKFTASLLIFTMFFQVLPISAFAGERTILPISRQTQYANASPYAVGNSGDSKGSRTNREIRNIKWRK
jgi:hypothetical protein